MKTKKIIISCATIVAIVGLLLIGCKKEENDTNNNSNNTNTDAATQTQRASDDSDVESNSNSAFDDANQAMEGFSGMSGKTNSIVPICGATYDSSQIASKILYLNFDSITPCVNSTVKRSGQIKLQLPTNVLWRDAGAVLTVTFNNYGVTRISDSKSIVFNGVATIKNISGGSWLNLLLGDSLIHQVRMNNMEVTFNDGKKGNWSGAWKRTISGSLVGSNYVITASVVGDTTVDAVNYVETWGTTRDGDAFKTTLNPPIVFNTVCLHKAISGVKTITVTNATIGTFVLNITVGVNADGTLTTSGCPYGIKLNWTNLQNQAQQLVIPYE